MNSRSNSAHSRFRLPDHEDPLLTRLISLLIFALLAGCASVTHWLPWVGSDRPVDGHLRLDTTVVPTAYEVDLTIDPTAGVFPGGAIDVLLASDTGNQNAWRRSHLVERRR